MTLSVTLFPHCNKIIQNAECWTMYLKSYFTIKKVMSLEQIYVKTTSTRKITAYQSRIYVINNIRMPELLYGSIPITLLCAVN